MFVNYNSRSASGVFMPVNQSMIIHPIRLRASNAYILELEDRLFLVDCGMPGDDKVILKHLASFSPKPLSLIYLTHAHIDHAGSAAMLRSKTGAQIAIHVADVEALEAGRTELGTVKGRGLIIKWLLPLVSLIHREYGAEADIYLSDLDELDKYGLNAKVVHTPGHTPGSSSLLTTQGDLFVGDLISTNGGPHIQRYYATDWKILRQSLARISHIEAKSIYPGHGFEIIDPEQLRNLMRSNNISPFT